MKITKFAQCCLLIEEGGVRVLTDPGTYSTAQNEEKNIDLIVITHEHQDHLHMESVKKILANNPRATIVSNSAVAKLLKAENIPCEVVEGTAATQVKGMIIEAHDGKHEEIFEDFGMVQNTGYLIAGRFFYPGDAFKAPEKPVEILALPVGGPWCKLSDALHYALKVNPKKAFNVHDAMFKKGSGFAAMIGAKILGPHGIEFIPMDEGETKEF